MTQFLWNQEEPFHSAQWIRITALKNLRNIFIPCPISKNCGWVRLVVLLRPAAWALCWVAGEIFWVRPHQQALVGHGKHQALVILRPSTIAQINVFMFALIKTKWMFCISPSETLLDMTQPCHTQSRGCRVIQSLHVRDWGPSRLNQNQFPVLWVCNWRCPGALLSEHPAHHCISHIQTSLTAVSTGHVHKSDLWSLLQHEVRRNMALVTIWENLGSHSCSNSPPFKSCSATEAQMQSCSQQNFSR